MSVLGFSDRKSQQLVFNLVLTSVISHTAAQAL
jgi:hypothetical protein